MKKRKICIILTTRGNYAKMKSVIERIEASDDLELQLILGGMVILEKYGRILDTVSSTTLTAARNINFVIEGGDLVTMTKSSGLAVSEFASVCEDLKPDIVVIIADRFECLSLAMTAAYMNIMVAHVEGGEVSGSIDESIRHAITKLSHIHFPASLDAAHRIEKMGEHKGSIHMVGGTSMDIIREMDLDELAPMRELQYGSGIGKILGLEHGKYLVVIQHPVTSEYDESLIHINETINALKILNMETVWIMPNMDAGSDGISKGIRLFREKSQPQNIHFFKSLAIEYYAPLLKNAACIIGNSSSGIREAAFLGAPSVNVGTRQNGRERGDNVIDVDYNCDQIVKAVRAQKLKGPFEPNYLFGDGYASQKIIDVLKSCELASQKTISY